MSPSRRAERRTPDEQRLVERFMRLAPQEKALILALAPFSDDSGQFDRELWVQSFVSPEPATIVQVKAVTGLYEGLVNHLVEMLLVAAKLRGLPVATATDKPKVRDLLDAVCDDGGITANQAEVLQRLSSTRNELQHASPGVEAEQVHADIRLLQRTLSRFVRSYLDWMKANDILVLQA